MVDVGMTEGVLALLPLLTTTLLNTGQAPAPGTSALDGGLPCYNIYETSDGRYITLAALEYRFWQSFCTHIGHLELLPLHQPTEPAERARAIELLSTIFKSKTRDEWLYELAGIDACVGPVYTLEEALSDPQIQARDIIASQPIGEAGETLRTLSSAPRISGLAGKQRYAPPTLGQHTISLLQELGYGADEIATFKAEGVI